MKKIFFTFLLFAICINGFSQNRRQLSESEAQVFQQKMVEHSRSIQTLRCTFVQERTSTIVSGTAVTRGTMLYRTPSMLRWEYAEPTPSTLILNGNNATLLDQNGNRMGNERMLRQLGGIIISMINGTGITQNRQFSSRFYNVSQTETLVVLIPNQRRLQELYDKIELRVNSQTMLANTITLYEKNGDKTKITLANKILNAEIPQSKFAIQ